MSTGNLLLSAKNASNTRRTWPSCLYLYQVFFWHTKYPGERSRYKGGRACVQPTCNQQITGVRVKPLRVTSKRARLRPLQRVHPSKGPIPRDRNLSLDPPDTKAVATLELRAWLVNRTLDKVLWVGPGVYKVDFLQNQSSSPSLFVSSFCKWGFAGDREIHLKRKMVSGHFDFWFFFLLVPFFSLICWFIKREFVQELDTCILYRSKWEPQQACSLSSNAIALIVLLTERKKANYLSIS